MAVIITSAIRLQPHTQTLIICKWLIRSRVVPGQGSDYAVPSKHPLVWHHSLLLVMPVRVRVRLLA